MIAHPIPPVYDSRSRVLILGSFPSVKSREQGFFYGHPQNRFWKLLARLFDDATPESIDDKKRFLLTHRVAVWDVIASCDIVGSSDASIENVVPNDISAILAAAPIRRIYCNGAKAYDLYRKYLEPQVGRAAEKLPSTSPANAAFSIERLASAWAAVPLQVRDE